MYNSALITFIRVADEGSFTRAAGEMYLSPTAVMKQINALEQHLGVQLFTRTSHGVQLTPGGKIIYRDAQKIIRFSRRSVEEARAAMAAEEKVFCVGTSLLNPAKVFMDLWAKAGEQFPGYRLHLVPFEDDHDGILGVIGSLGEKFDFLVGVCDSRQWLDQCQMLPLGHYRKMVALPRSHPLANRERLTLDDLEGETLMMVPEGDSGVNDQIRAMLRSQHPGIRIEDTSQFYDVSVFNRCAETGKPLLTLECWKDVHPALKTLPVEWDYTIPYGLLYSLHPPEDVERYVEAVRSLTEFP